MNPPVPLFVQSPEAMIEKIESKMRFVEFAGANLAKLIKELCPHVCRQTIDDFTDSLAVLINSDSRQFVETLRNQPKSPPDYRYNTPGWTAEDLVKANEGVTEMQEAMEAARKSVDSIPEDARGLVRPQMLILERSLEQSIAHRDHIQKALEESRGAIDWPFEPDAKSPPAPNDPPME